jgi:ketosteroid isomerase-like protein
MHRIERKDAVVDGNQVAARWVAHVQFPGREPFDTELFNLWSFDEDGRVTKLREFCDTAKLASEVEALGGG